ncbi:MAG: CHAT domain-containing protein, partial [Leptolyngbyaceae cyanobacterium SL_5_14]|nr:CHAT domain-containing protein [Leptolyngbyaceae cyanobacterium SL_5_14]
MPILHLDLKAIKGDVVELRYFWDNPNTYQSRSLSLAEIAHLTKDAEERYYVSSKVRDNLATIGRELFNWLDGSDRWLVSQLSERLGETVVLAIATAGQLSHLPWEVLHDGSQFLVQRYPAVVPVRWQSSDWVTRLSAQSDSQNRALRVLFMATSPRSVEPVLDYEQEEAEILKAASRPSIGLTVEESGCLKELGDLADSYGVEPSGRRYFDVVHLTGHATIRQGQPQFITETATGEAHYASAEAIARTLKPPLPTLIFLSGCRTGQAGNGGAVPSMAEQLLQYGATAVLGWGQPVLDIEASRAAATLYEALSRSNPLTEALALTYQALIKQEARDWHLLRLYVSQTLPGALVKPDRTLGWQPAPPPSVATEFLDPLTRNVRVPTRESFVGRRRQLQNCLRALTQFPHSPETLGVLIHGMGGLGKSSLAARICDRLPHFKRLVWQGRVDSANLVNKLAEALEDRTLRERLQDPNEALKFRLKWVFSQLAQGATPFLLVLDDFEENLEARGSGYMLKAPAVEVWQALVWAIRQGNPRHRLILTSRYDFEASDSGVLYRQPMDALQGADLRKKCERLSALKPPQLEPEATEETKQAARELVQLQTQAKQLADGNPRLLETLNSLTQLQQQTTQLPDRQERLNLLQTERQAQPQIAQATTLEQLKADP